MAKPMATGRELTRLRKKGLEATPANLRKVKAELRAEDLKKSEAANRAAGKRPKAGPAVTEPAGGAKGKKRGGSGVAAAKRAVTEPAGRYNKGGMAKKKKKC